MLLLGRALRHHAEAAGQEPRSAWAAASWSSPPLLSARSPLLRGAKGVPRKGGLNIGQHEGLNMQIIE